jgi:nucleoside 2-deoxyribosyltransferase
MSKKIYIAGPMRGFPKFNFPAFDAAKDRLTLEGWDVLSPADLDREVGFDESQDSGQPSKEFLDEALRRDVEAILQADAIYMLTGWKNSTGATAEYWLARWRHIPVFEEGAALP